MLRQLNTFLPGRTEQRYELGKQDYEPGKKQRAQSTITYNTIGKTKMHVRLNLSIKKTQKTYQGTAKLSKNARGDIKHQEIQ